MKQYYKITVDNETINLSRGSMIRKKKNQKNSITNWMEDNDLTVKVLRN